MATSPDAHRPPMVWYTNLQKAKAEGTSGNIPKVTIQDLLERINDPNADEQQLIPSSPRSVQACFQLGIDPVDLQFHPLNFYKHREDADEDVTKLRYERYEAVRQERLRQLIEERKNLIDSGWPPSEKKTLKRSDSGREAGSSMVEKERQRLEVLKRRQEKELQQMVQYESTRKELLEKQQKRVDEQERRAMEQTRVKAEHEAERMARQRDIELQKLAEEKEFERRARIMAEERYKHEKKMQAEREETERLLRQKGYTEEMERRHKAEEARKETEAILAAQAEEVRLKKVEMERRDAERLKRMEQELKEKHAANIVKRKKAEARISTALEHNAHLMRARKQAFEQKEAEAEARRREMEVIHIREEAAKREEEARKQIERQEKYIQALDTEEMRKMSVKERAAEKERLMAELHARRKKEHDLRKVETDFELKLRLDRVDSIQKTALFNRQQLLEKIMGDYDKTRDLLRERQSLQEQRKMANMTASLQRQEMTKAMESLKYTKNVGSLTSGGAVNINDLLKRKTVK